MSEKQDNLVVAVRKDHFKLTAGANVTASAHAVFRGTVDARVHPDYQKLKYYPSQDDQITSFVKYAHSQEEQHELEIEFAFAALYQMGGQGFARTVAISEPGESRKIAGMLSSGLPNFGEYRKVGERKARSINTLESTTYRGPHRDELSKIRDKFLATEEQFEVKLQAHQSMLDLYLQTKASFSQASETEKPDIAKALIDLRKALTRTQGELDEVSRTRHQLSERAEAIAKKGEKIQKILSFKRKRSLKDICEERKVPHMFFYSLSAAVGGLTILGLMAHDYLKERAKKQTIALADGKTLELYPEQVKELEQCDETWKDFLIKGEEGENRFQKEVKKARELADSIFMHTEFQVENGHAKAFNNQKNLLPVLMRSWTFGEDDLHRNNFGHYQDKNGSLQWGRLDFGLSVPEVTHNGRPIRADGKSKLLGSNHSFTELTLKDYQNFPCLEDSTLFYWPATYRFISSMVNPKKGNRYEKEDVELFRSLKDNPEFLQAKYEYTLKQFFLPESIQLASIRENLSDKNVSHRIADNLAHRLHNFKMIALSDPGFLNYFQNVHQEYECVKLLVSQGKATMEELKQTEFVRLLTEVQDDLSNVSVKNPPSPIEFSDVKSIEDSPLFKELEPFIGSLDVQHGVNHLSEHERNDPSSALNMRLNLQVEQVYAVLKSSKYSPKQRDELLRKSFLKMINATRLCGGDPQRTLNIVHHLKTQSVILNPLRELRGDLKRAKSSGAISRTHEQSLNQGLELLEEKILEVLKEESNAKVNQETWKAKDINSDLVYKSALSGRVRNIQVGLNALFTQYQHADRREKNKISSEIRQLTKVANYVLKENKLTDRASIESALSKVEHRIISHHYKAHAAPLLARRKGLRKFRGLDNPVRIWHQNLVKDNSELMNMIYERVEKKGTVNHFSLSPTEDNVFTSLNRTRLLLAELLDDPDGTVDVLELSRDLARCPKKNETHLHRAEFYLSKAVLKAFVKGIEIDPDDDLTSEALAYGTQFISQIHDHHARYPEKELKLATRIMQESCQLLKQANDPSKTEEERKIALNSCGEKLKFLQDSVGSERKGIGKQTKDWFRQQWVTVRRSREESNDSKTSYYKLCRNLPESKASSRQKTKKSKKRGKAIEMTEKQIEEKQARTSTHQEIEGDGQDKESPGRRLM